MDNSKIKDNFIKLKDYFANMSDKMKKILLIAVGALVLLSVIIAVVINSSSGKYTALYSELSTAESGSVFQALKEMGADAKIGSDGKVMVPTEEYDVWILQLAAKGYPKSALPYDVFSSHAGMTTTESEKAYWLLAQLQDRIQATLERMECVESATVTINVPETSNNVWQLATTESKSTAGVLLSLRGGISITAEQVSAIRNLVAASVPKMKPEDVTVVDAATMLDLNTITSAEQKDEESQRLAFELMVQNQIEQNVVRLLSARYGREGVVAVAKVTLDYDKMMTEKYELQPKNEEGDGFLTHTDGKYTINGQVTAGEVVGEENNTDIPGYAYNELDGEDGMTDYDWNNDFDYGYIKTQIESGKAILKRATVSVMVDEESLTPNRREDIINIVSAGTDIPIELINVSAFNKAAIEGEPTETTGTPFDYLLELPMWVYIAAGVGLLILIVIVCVIIVAIKKRKSEKYDRLAVAADAKRMEEEMRQQREIDAYKRSLEDMAKSSVDPKNEAIIEEVRSFARSDPQITANLLRTWLKED